VWNDYYNNLEHCGLDGKTPNEMLANAWLLNRQMCVLKTHDWGILSQLVQGLMS
jgi:hypothetical protein